MLKGTDDIGCCLDQIYIAIFIGKDVTGVIHDLFDLLCGIGQMILDDVFT
jgi:hypothetical protein